MKSNSKIVLINTSFVDKNIKSFDKLFPPFGLLSIASPLVKAGFEVVLIDPQLEENYYKKIEEELKHAPLFVGMTTFMGTNIVNAINISKKVKEINEKIPIVWGGPMATSSPEICLETGIVDYVVMGMGEKIVVELAQSIKNGVDISELKHISLKRGNDIKLGCLYILNTEINDFDYPQLKMWEEGIKRMGIIPILSSRGCPRNCAFCINNILVGNCRWLFRSADDVLAEMDYWADYFQIKDFFFIDDNFLVDTKRACRILKESKGKGHNVTRLTGHLMDYKPEVLEHIVGYVDRVGFAIEAASPRMQKIIRKGLNIDKAIAMFQYFTDQKIKTISTNFMFGFPSEDDDDILMNIQTACRIREINEKIRIVPAVYFPQPGDDIMNHFPELLSQIHFTMDHFAQADFTPNRSNYLAEDIRPWMTKEDVQFYLDLVLVWFYYFDYIVRESQNVDVDAIFERNPRLAALFKDIERPVVGA